MKWVLFFDGDCGFCSRGVSWVYKLDGKGEVDFAPLQGVLSREMGFEGSAEKRGGTVVLLREEDGVVFFKGDAVIELCGVLGGGWAALGWGASVLPAGLRDWGYDFVARYRHLISGKRSVCGVLDEGLRGRMRG